MRCPNCGWKGSTQRQGRIQGRSYEEHQCLGCRFAWGVQTEIEVNPAATMSLSITDGKTTITREITQS